MIKAIIFDFDGVLHDSFEYHRQKIIEFTKLDLSIQDYKDFHNGNFYKSKHPIVKNTNWREYGKFIYPSMSKLVMKTEIKKTLESLRKKYKLFIVSSGLSRTINAFLDFNKIKFDDVYGLDRAKAKIDNLNSLLKEHKLGRGECVYVTDTVGDIKEAKIVEIKAIGIEGGYHDREFLEKEKPFAIVANFEEIEKIVRMID